MADTPKKICAGTLGTASATLYTAPADTKVLITEISLANKTAAAAAASILLDDVTVIPAYSVAANNAINPPMHHVLDATKTIKGFAGTTSAIDYYISGVEVT